MISSTSSSRRMFLKTTAASALAGVVLPQVHAGEDNTIKLALIGCGGRGGGAAGDALKTTGGPTRLVAMADVIPSRIKTAHTALTNDFAKQIEPILAATCYKCHGEKDKGELYLNKKESILKGGESAEDGDLTLVAGQPDKSLLYKLISLPEGDPDIMPPKGDPLTKEQQYVGFDAYRKAMDTLRPGEIVILATPLAFRWVHYQYAIERGLHVFMEKPVIADGPSAKRMLNSRMRWLTE